MVFQDERGLFIKEKCPWNKCHRLYHWCEKGSNKYVVVYLNIFYLQWSHAPRFLQLNWKWLSVSGVFTFCLFATEPIEEGAGGWRPAPSGEPPESSLTASLMTPNSTQPPRGLGSLHPSQQEDGWDPLRICTITIQVKHLFINQTCFKSDFY